MIKLFQEKSMMTILADSAFCKMKEDSWSCNLSFLNIPPPNPPPNSPPPKKKQYD